MKKLWKITVVACFVLVVGACGSGVAYVDDGQHHADDHYSDAIYVYEPVVAVADTPALEAFDLVDSYDVNTELSPNTALKINPFLYDGWFEIYWQADSYDDYWAEFYINDSPTIDNSIYVGSQMCGFGQDCDKDGLQFCQYTSDFALSCDTGENNVADVAPLVYAVPQTLYFILQLCDLGYGYCEYSYYPVLME